MAFAKLFKSKMQPQKRAEVRICCSSKQSTLSDGHTTGEAQQEPQSSAFAVMADRGRRCENPDPTYLKLYNLGTCCTKQLNESVREFWEQRQWSYVVSISHLTPSNVVIKTQSVFLHSNTNVSQCVSSLQPKQKWFWVTQTSWQLYSLLKLMN